MRVLGWLRRWGLSLASLIGGLLTLFVFRREIEHVRWIVGYLLVLWLLLAVLAQVGHVMADSPRRVHRLAVTAADYTIQSLYHGVLLFLIPPYWASTTLTSPNAVYLGLLLLLVTIATVDPWYRTLVRPHPWVGYLFLLVSTFGALNLALPLIGVPPHVALTASAWIAVLGLTPAVRRAQGWTWLHCLGVTSTVALGVAALAHAGRVWIPPAPLSLARTALTWESTLETGGPVPRPIPAELLHRRGLVAYTDIYAPAGLRQPIRHVWRHDGEVVDVVELSPLRGGRREGFRTFSRKTGFPAHAEGRWSVDVVTSSGQLIGRLRFQVTP